MSAHVCPPPLQLLTCDLPAADEEPRDEQAEDEPGNVGEEGDGVGEALHSPKFASHGEMTLSGKATSRAVAHLRGGRDQLSRLPHALERETLDEEEAYPSAAISRLAGRGSG